MKLIYAGYIACVVFIISSISLVVSVIGEIDWIENIGLFFMFTSAFVMAAGFFAALFKRKWKLLIGLFAAQVVAYAIGFFCAILCGVGQHHPPHHGEEIESESYCDSIEDLDSIEATEASEAKVE